MIVDLLKNLLSMFAKSYTIIEISSALDEIIKNYEENNHSFENNTKNQVQKILALIITELIHKDLLNNEIIKKIKEFYLRIRNDNYNNNVEADLVIVKKLLKILKEDLDKLYKEFQYIAILCVSYAALENQPSATFKNTLAKDAQKYLYITKPTTEDIKANEFRLINYINKTQKIHFLFDLFYCKLPCRYALQIYIRIFELAAQSAFLAYFYKKENTSFDLELARNHEDYIKALAHDKIKKFYDCYNQVGHLNSKLNKHQDLVEYKEEYFDYIIYKKSIHEELIAYNSYINSQPTLTSIPLVVNKFNKQQLNDAAKKFLHTPQGLTFEILKDTFAKKYSFVENELNYLELLKDGIYWDKDTLAELERLFFIFNKIDKSKLDEKNRQNLVYKISCVLQCFLKNTIRQENFGIKINFSLFQDFYGSLLSISYEDKSFLTKLFFKILQYVVIDSKYSKHFESLWLLTFEKNPAMPLDARIVILKALYVHKHLHKSFGLMIESIFHKIENPSKSKYQKICAKLTYYFNDYVDENLPLIIEDIAKYYNLAKNFHVFTDRVAFDIITALNNFLRLDENIIKQEIIQDCFQKLASNKELYKNNFNIFLSVLSKKTYILSDYKFIFDNDFHFTEEQIHQILYIVHQSHQDLSSTACASALATLSLIMIEDIYDTFLPHISDENFLLFHAAFVRKFSTEDFIYESNSRIQLQEHYQYFKDLQNLRAEQDSHLNGGEKPSAAYLELFSILKNLLNSLYDGFFDKFVTLERQKDYATKILEFLRQTTDLGKISSEYQSQLKNLINDFKTLLQTEITNIGKICVFTITLIEEIKTFISSSQQQKIEIREEKRDFKSKKEKEKYLKSQLGSFMSLSLINLHKIKESGSFFELAEGTNIEEEYMFQKLKAYYLLVTDNMEEAKKLIDNLYNKESSNKHKNFLLDELELYATYYQLNSEFQKNIYYVDKILNQKIPFTKYIFWNRTKIHSLNHCGLIDKAQLTADNLVKFGKQISERTYEYCLLIKARNFIDYGIKDDAKEILEEVCFKNTKFYQQVLNAYKIAFEDLNDLQIENFNYSNVCFYVKKLIYNDFFEKANKIITTHKFFKLNMVSHNKMLAKLLTKQQDPFAIDFLKELVEKSFNNSFKIQLGSAYHKLGNYVESLRIYEELNRTMPSSLFENMIILNLKKLNPNNPDIEKKLLKLIEKYPSDYQAYISLIKHYYVSKNLKNVNAIQDDFFKKFKNNVYAMEKLLKIIRPSPSISDENVMNSNYDVNLLENIRVNDNEVYEDIDFEENEIDEYMEINGNEVDEDIDFKYNKSKKFKENASLVNQYSQFKSPIRLHPRYADIEKNESLCEYNRRIRIEALDLHNYKWPRFLSVSRAEKDIIFNISQFPMFKSDSEQELPLKP